jgi:hypothetical protein
MHRCTGQTFASQHFAGLTIRIHPRVAPLGEKILAAGATENRRVPRAISCKHNFVRMRYILNQPGERRDRHEPSTNVVMGREDEMELSLSFENMDFQDYFAGPEL